MTNFIDTRRGLENYLSSPAAVKRENDYLHATPPHKEAMRLATLEQKAELMRALREASIMDKCVTECPVIRMLLAGCTADASWAMTNAASMSELAERHTLRMERVLSMASCAGHVTKLEAVVDASGEEDIIPVERCTADDVEISPSLEPIAPAVLEPIYS